MSSKSEGDEAKSEWEKGNEVSDWLNSVFIEPE